jgi:hypothetical protein
LGPLIEQLKALGKRFNCICWRELL